MINCKNYVVPTINVNDDSVTIGTIHKLNLEQVEIGDLLCCLETSKANEDFISDVSGFIVWHVKEYDVVKIGVQFCSIYENEMDAREAIANKENASTKEVTVKASKKAIEYAASIGFDINQIRKEGIIKTSDIDEFIAAMSGKTSDLKKTNETFKSNDVVLVGAGGLALMVIDAINSTKNYNIIGLVDDFAKRGDVVYGYEVLGAIEETLPMLYSKGLRLAVNCIGGMASRVEDSLFVARQSMAIKLKTMGFLLPNVIHNRAIIEPTCTIGEGNIILAGANIGSKAVIGDNCYINTNTMISHECVIDDGVRVSPGAILAGRIHVGENTLIGMSSTVYMGIKIGKNVIIYNGVDVFSNISDGKVVSSASVK